MYAVCISTNNARLGCKNGEIKIGSQGLAADKNIIE